MSSQYTTYNYKISYQPIIRDKEYGHTPELNNKLEYYYKAAIKEDNKKIIGELLNAIEKYPKSPILKNYLTLAYKFQGKNDKAKAANERVLKEHPDYIYAIINKVSTLIDEKKYEEARKMLGEDLELQALYPERNEFHIGEFSSYYTIVIKYLCAIGNIELAENRLELLKKFEEREDIIEKAESIILYAKITGNVDYDDDDDDYDENEVEPSFIGKKLPAQTTQKPAFNHKEVEWLYEYDLEITEDKIDAILALPRTTLIQDLETILQDCTNRYEYFQQKDSDVPSSEMPIHAIFFLTELKATESLPTIISFLSYDDEFLGFWLGDFLTEEIWLSFFVLGKDQLPLIKDFLLQPNTYAFAKSVATTALEQMSVYYPDMQNELYLVFKEVYEKFAVAKIEDDLIDSTFLELSFGDAYRCNFEELLPIIKLLFDKGYATYEFGNSYEDLIQSYKKSSTNKYSINDIRNLKQLYAHVVENWESYTDDEKHEDDRDFNDEFDDYEEILPIRTEPKIGRNDPCPCGSGKKYKKCCLK